MKSPITLTCLDGSNPGSRHCWRARSVRRCAWNTITALSSTLARRVSVEWIASTLRWASMPRESRKCWRPRGRRRGTTWSVIKALLDESRCSLGCPRSRMARNPAGSSSPQAPTRRAEHRMDAARCADHAGARRSAGIGGRGRVGRRSRAQTRPRRTSSAVPGALAALSGRAESMRRDLNREAHNPSLISPALEVVTPIRFTAGSSTRACWYASAPISPTSYGMVIGQFASPEDAVSATVMSAEQ